MAVDLTLIISTLSLTGVITLGLLQVYYARRSVTREELRAQRETLEGSVNDLINRSILEGNINRVIEAKLEPIREDIKEIKTILLDMQRDRGEKHGNGDRDRGG